MNLDEGWRGWSGRRRRGRGAVRQATPRKGYECFWITACPEINQEREIATVCGPQNERNINAALIAALRNSARRVDRGCEAISVVKGTLARCRL